MLAPIPPSISGDGKNEEAVRENCLDGLAELPYHERLTRFLWGAARHWVAGGISVIDFRPLYTVTLYSLQRQLAQEIQNVEEKNITDEQLSRMRGTLHEYSTSSLTLTALTCLPNTPPSQRAP
ncbi:hypothetical protein IG631_14317 [Alternaria alternata]|nr:hypothetical protein IG631_14317 [Alternaria alternata]